MSKTFDEGLCQKEEKKATTLVAITIEMELPVERIEQLLKESNGSLERFIIDLASKSMLNY